MDLDLSSGAGVPPHAHAGGGYSKPLSVLEVERDADASFLHKSQAVLRMASASGGVGPLDDWAVRRAEDRLGEANRRIRIVQAEAAQLDSLRQQQLASGEEEILKVKRRLLDEWEGREREWERRKEAELRSLKMQEAVLLEKERNLTELEEQAERQLAAQEDAVQHREKRAEEDRIAWVADTERRLRQELRREMEPQMHRELEKELAQRITHEIREELQQEFLRLCQQMKEDVDAARVRLRAEIEQELTPVIEQRVFQDCKGRAEQDVHAMVLTQLRDANHATQLLKEELASALDARDRAHAENQSMRTELTAARNNLRNAASDGQRLREATQEAAQLRAQLGTLEAEHALLQQAAAGVLKQARTGPPPPQGGVGESAEATARRNVSPPREVTRTAHAPGSPFLQSLAERLDGGGLPARYPPSHATAAGAASPHAWPPRLLPGGGVMC